MRLTSWSPAWKPVSYAGTISDAQRMCGRNHRLSHSPSPSGISRRGKPKIRTSADDQHLCFCFLFSQKITGLICSLSQIASNLSICFNSFPMKPSTGSSGGSQLQHKGYPST